ncbi:MAG: hypothetical protein CM1200mP16_17000 [Nitrospina sp.]|nr:MAG: hypothetical protein CM1200mP16_17000 [Nitrospina sp.]
MQKVIKPTFNIMAFPARERELDEALAQVEKESAAMYLLG